MGACIKQNTYKYLLWLSEEFVSSLLSNRSEWRNGPRNERMTAKLWTRLPFLLMAGQKTYPWRFLYRIMPIMEGGREEERSAFRNEKK